MSATFFTLMVITMLAVLGSLVIGVFGMAKGGAFNQKYGNKLMRARVFFERGEFVRALADLDGAARLEPSDPEGQQGRAWILATCPDAKIRNGASLVQLFTAMVYEGPLLARRIALGLAKLLERDGFTSVSQAVGADVR